MAQRNNCTYNKQNMKTSREHLEEAENDIQGMRLHDAMGHLLKAAEICKNESEDQYVHCVMHAFNFLKIIETAEKPSWWTDDQLLALSEKAIFYFPGAPLAWDMRGRVLMGEFDYRDKRARSSDDYMAAANAFRTHMKLNARATQMLQPFIQQCEAYATAAAQRGC